jgi:aminopeptidase N
MKLKLYSSFILWKVTEFEETPVMSTYLLAFTVSDFRNITSSGEPEFSVYASVKEFNNMEFALNVGRDLLKALENFTGQPYSLSKMDFIAIDDFLYGAMVTSLFKLIEFH